VFYIQPMDQHKRLSLLNRQLTDLQAQAERIIKGNNSSEALETFSRFAVELKEFVKLKMESPKLSQEADLIPDIDYEKSEISLRQFILMPSWFYAMYKDQQKREALVEEVRNVRNAFAEFQLSVQEMLYELQ
jgi:hypothetical protein